MSNETPEVKSNVSEGATKELSLPVITLEEVSTFIKNFNGQTAPQLVNILNKHSEEIATLTKQVNQIFSKLLETK
jgi:hypothetical protein